MHNHNGSASSETSAVPTRRVIKKGLKGNKVMLERYLNDPDAPRYLGDGVMRTSTPSSQVDPESSDSWRVLLGNPLPNQGKQSESGERNSRGGSGRHGQEKAQ